MGCVFCAVVAGTEPASIVHEDEHVLAFCDLFPVNPGHLLVVPKAHSTGLAELDPADGARVFAVAHRLAAAVRGSGLRCEGVNLFLADGEPAGQEVFHTHLHVIPRHAGDGFRLHSGQSRTPAGRADLDGVAAAIRAAGA